MNVLIRGDLPWCVGAVSVGAVAPRAVLTGQRSAEVVVPAGLWLLGRTERWELTGGAVVLVIVAMIAANPRGRADRCGGTGESGRALGCA